MPRFAFPLLLCGSAVDFEVWCDCPAHTCYRAFPRNENCKIRTTLALCLPSSIKGMRKKIPPLQRSPISNPQIQVSGTQALQTMSFLHSFFASTFRPQRTRISFDLDDTLACHRAEVAAEPGYFPTFIHRWLGEPLRHGTGSLMRELRRRDAASGFTPHRDVRRCTYGAGCCCMASGSTAWSTASVIAMDWRPMDFRVCPQNSRRHSVSICT